MDRQTKDRKVIPICYTVKTNGNTTEQFLVFISLKADWGNNSSFPFTKSYIGLLKSINNLICLTLSYQLVNAISPFDTMFSTFSHRLSIHLQRFIHSFIEIFYVLTKYVQSHLLHNCRMRERVNITDKIALKQEDHDGPSIAHLI